MTKINIIQIYKLLTCPKLITRFWNQNILNKLFRHNQGGANPLTITYSLHPTDPSQNYPDKFGWLTHFYDQATQK